MKQLPFFKFFPSEWDNGDIQRCPPAQQGIFINLCSFYWARKGDVSWGQAVDKVGYQNHLRALVEKGIIQLVGKQIQIRFLDEQLTGMAALPAPSPSPSPPVWYERRTTPKKFCIRFPQGTGCFQSEEKKRKDEEKEEKENRKRKNVIPPKVEWIAAYCKERKNRIDPEHFYDFYQSKDWLVGKSRMVDWEAAIRNWERRNKQDQAPARGKKGSRSGSFGGYKYKNKNK